MVQHCLTDSGIVAFSTWEGVTGLSLVSTDGSCCLCFLPVLVTPPTVFQVVESFSETLLAILRLRVSCGLPGRGFSFSSFVMSELTDAVSSVKHGSCGKMDMDVGRANSEPSSN